jgi:hypothetical protein
MAIEYEFPVFIIARGATKNADSTMISFHDYVTLTSQNHPPALAVFTDKDGAEPFRDDDVSTYQVFSLDGRIGFAQLLRGLPPGIGFVAFDPYRIGKKAQTGSVEDVLRGLLDLGAGMNQ